MKAVDSSVLIAGFASWHEHHKVAVAALRGAPRLVAHAAVEAYSVLTRLPPPHRAAPGLVHEFITRRFTEPWLVLTETAHRELLATAAAGHVRGGQVYDALIAYTAAENDASLLSLDQRAAVTYSTVGVEVDLLAP